MVGIPDDASTVELVVWTVVAIGALNWAAFALWDFNLVVEVLGTKNAAPAYIVIGALGAINLADIYGLLELSDV